MPDPAPDPTPLPTALSVELTAACNQRCAHCYNAWRAEGDRAPARMETAALLALLDRVTAEVGLERLTLSGGEPLLHPDFRPIVDHLRGGGVELFLITNGTLVDDEVARFLAPCYGTAPAAMESVALDGAVAICGAGSYD